MVKAAKAEQNSATTNTQQGVSMEHSRKQWNHIFPQNGWSVLIAKRIGPQHTFANAASKPLLSKRTLMLNGWAMDKYKWSLEMIQMRLGINHQPSVWWWHSSFRLLKSYISYTLLSLPLHLSFLSSRKRSVVYICLFQHALRIADGTSPVDVVSF